MQRQVRAIVGHQRILERTDDAHEARSDDEA
jgi:hypothetical protein